MVLLLMGVVHEIMIWNMLMPINRLCCLKTNYVADRCHRYRKYGSVALSPIARLCFADIDAVHRLLGGFVFEIQRRGCF